MNHSGNLKLSLAGAVALFLCASPALARPAYSCKRDKALEVPMQFNALVESGGRVHLSAYGGSDKSGWIAPYNNGAWRVIDASGRQVTRFTESLLAFASTEMLKESTVEGLLPGAYMVQLISIDLCGNQGQATRSITIPTATSEITQPVIADLQPMLLSSFGASAYALYFTASDDTAIKRVTVEVNGSVLADFTYFNGTTFRWWTDFFPEDGTNTAFEGPNFYVGYDSAYKGQCGVRVTAEDLSGNQTVSTGTFCLP
jgi:hypothetical protein